jgi:hypothetical protein
MIYDNEIIKINFFFFLAQCFTIYIKHQHFHIFIIILIFYLLEFFYQLSDYILFHMK